MTKRVASLGLVSLLLLTLNASVTAQTVFRCGNAYSQNPCPHGHAIDAGDPRTAAQRAEARRVAADERKAAAQMARERRAEQAALKPATATIINSRPPRADAHDAKPVPPPKKKKKHSAREATGTTDFVSKIPAKGK